MRANRQPSASWRVPVLVLLVFGLFSMACSGSVDQSGGDIEEQLQTVATDNENPYPEGIPSISVVSPADGAVLPALFEVEVEVDQFELEPAGRSLAGQGHWHIIVDEGCVDPGLVFPSGPRFIDVADGSTSKAILLGTGTHELCIQIGDGFHVAVDITDSITVTVE